mgnify:CR=1 FL=1
MGNDETILELYSRFANEIYTITTEKWDISRKICKEQDLLNDTLTKEQRNILKRLNKLEDEKMK